MSRWFEWLGRACLALGLLTLVVAIFNHVTFVQLGMPSVLGCVQVNPFGLNCGTTLAGLATNVVLSLPLIVVLAFIITLSVPLGFGTVYVHLLPAALLVDAVIVVAAIYIVRKLIAFMRRRRAR